MSYYPEPNNHIREKVKLLLVLSNYATKKKLEHATGLDISDLAAKKYFVALELKVDKLEINELDKILTGLNKLKTKAYDLNVDKIKAAPNDLKKLSDVVVDKEVIKNTKPKKINTKTNNLEKKIPDASTLVKKINATQTNKTQKKIL